MMLRCAVAFVASILSTHALVPHATSRVHRRLAAADAPEVEMPEPRVGDVVAFAGDWPGESKVGQIRSLQPRGAAWLADVVPLEDQANDVWRLPSAARARKRRVAVDVAELVPLEATAAGEDDAFVLARQETAEPASKALTGSAVGLLPKAAGYRALDDGFVPKGGTPKLDYAAEQRSKEEYEALKAQLLADSALAAGAGLVLSAAITRDVSDVGAYAVGAAGGLAYVFGLSQFADQAGEDSKPLLDLSKYRLLFPVVPFLGLAGANVAGGSTPGNLNLVPFDQFVAAAAGVLSYRVPLLVRQVFGGSGATADDVVGLLPGSLGKGARAAVEARDAAKRGDVEEDAVDTSKTVLVVCGPPGAVKTTLVERLLADDARFAKPAWTTTDRGAAGGDVLLRDDDFEADRGGLAVVFEDDGDAATLLEAAAPKKRGLPRAALLDRADGRVALVDCDVATAKQLATLDGARLVGVWVSLESLDALRDRLARVEAGRAAADPANAGVAPDDLAAAVAATVKARLATVVDDIDFGVRSPMFEFTIITSALDEDAAYAKLQRAAGYVF